MAQTNTKSDAFCSYNQSATPFFWIMQSHQYENTFVDGEVGINANGGAPGSYVRPEVVDIDSFLSGRDDILSKCQPPVPSLDSIKPEKIKKDGPTVNLLPKYTREKKSAVELSSVDYNRWQPQDIDPQDLRFIIEAFVPQRGGLDTQNYTKLAWKKDSFQYKDPQACKNILNPNRACGEYCETVSGYPGKKWNTGEKLNSSYKPYKKPPNEPNYPFNGPYSQDVFNVGADNGGPNFFYGDKYDKGSIPKYSVDVLPDNGALRGP